MSGFLDKNDRIIDMVLTGYGKDLLSKGELRFVYWVPFDNDIDYDPPIMNSASLSADGLNQAQFDQIEATLVEEAKSGYRQLNKSGSDFTNVFRPIFTMPQGQHILPRVNSSTHQLSGSITLETKQRKLIDLHMKKDQFGNVIEQLGPYDRGYERYDASSLTLNYGYTSDSFPPDFQSEGFFIRVYRSGSEGCAEVNDRSDIDNEIAYNNDLRFFPDGIGVKRRAE